MITLTQKRNHPNNVVVATYELLNEDKEQVARDLSSDLNYYTLTETVEVRTRNIYNKPESNTLVQVATVTHSSNATLQRVIDALGLGIN